MKNLLSLILVLTLTLIPFASCGKTEEALTAIELLDLGEKYLLDLDYEQAIVYFNKVIEVEPNNKAAYLGLAEAYSALGDKEAAIEVLTTALEIFSDDTNTTLEVYEKLAEVDSSNYVWYIEPAQVYISQGNTESAVSLLQNGLENAESTEEIEKMLYTVEEAEHPSVKYNSDGSYNEYEYDKDWNAVRETYYDEGGNISSVIEYGEESAYTWTTYSSSGNVSSIYEYDTNGNKIKNVQYRSDGSLQNIYEYDSDGNRIREEWYSDGNLSIVIEYTYDSDGNVIHKKGTYYNSDSTVYYQSDIDYDLNGNSIKYIRYEGGLVTEGWEREYDSNGNITKRITYNEDGSSYISSESEYDSDGNVLKSIDYNEDGSISRWYEYEYDSNSNVTMYKAHSSNGRAYTWYECEYDSNGYLVKWTDYHSDGSVWSWYEYEYDESGLCTKFTEHYEDENESPSWEEYEYDSEGLLYRYTIYFYGEMWIYCIYEEGVGWTAYYPDGTVYETVGGSRNSASWGIVK